MIHAIRVRSHGKDHLGESLLAEARRVVKLFCLKQIRTVKVYRFEGISEEQTTRLAQALFMEPGQLFLVDLDVISLVDETFDFERARKVEVAYKPGVMNPEVASILKAAGDLGMRELEAVDSSMEYFFSRFELSEEMAQDELTCLEADFALDLEVQLVLDRLIVNDTVQHIPTSRPTTLKIGSPRVKTEIVPMRDLSDDQLSELASRYQLFLNRDEMIAIRAHVRDLDRDPTDCEIRTLAAAWSEHCGHKTTRATLMVDGIEKPSLIGRLKDGVHALGLQLDVVSAFHDNAGAFRFYDGWCVAMKNETHNSPSAIEPYGGAATGSGGVFRDIMGMGLGASIILSLDMFCFAPPTLSFEFLPPGCLHPEYLLRRVVSGVRDYGNRMGIPTSQGSVHVHPDFRAKPTVIVGACGLLPEKYVQKGVAQRGDLIVVIGGRTGRDGLGGATFSSGAMTDQTMTVHSSAVQIGNAIEEKRMSEALLVCRDADLIRAITDCGAAGFSSAIGEMGEATGVRVYLERAPLKYPGLAPWEIWLSESQERMIAAVAPAHVERFIHICREYNTQAVVMGEFTDTKRLLVTYEDEMVCNLSMIFLHHGLPDRTLVAKWIRPQFAEPTIMVPQTEQDWVQIYERVMGHWNVCSKEPIVRQYDHTVQGTNALPPFGGATQDAPNDAVVLKPLYGKPYGLVVGHGMNPILNRIDPYWGSVWAATEALANITAVGGNPSNAYLVDNFIWPFPDEDALGALDMAFDACADVMREFRAPFISGKDSLSSTYRGKDGTVIKIPPVLCVTAASKMSDASLTVSSDFKDVNKSIFLVGDLHPHEMAGSVYYDLHGAVGNQLPKVDLDQAPYVLRKLYAMIHAGILVACHDISEGGLAVALAEMCFGAGCGAEIDITQCCPGQQVRSDHLLFNEMAGCFLVEVADARMLDWLSGSHLACYLIGWTTREPMITVREGERLLFSASLASLKAAWQKPMQEVFQS